MSQMLDTIKTLCRLPGPSGWEDAVRDYIRAEAAPYADELIVDQLGSLLVFKKGRKQPKKPILLAAHMDEVGVVIKEIDDDGFFTEDLDASDFLDDEIASENSDDDTFGL